MGGASPQVQITSRPVSTGEALLATGDDIQIVAFNLSRCLVAGRFEDFTSFLVDEGMAGASTIGTGINLPDLMVLATGGIHFKGEVTLAFIKFGKTLLSVG